MKRKIFLVNKSYPTRMIACILIAIGFITSTIGFIIPGIITLAFSLFILGLNSL